MPDEEGSAQRSPRSMLSKDACQECRLNKVKCSFASRSSRCQRCAKHDFECNIVTGKKRGRKAKSKVALLGPAAASAHSAASRTARRATIRNDTRDGLQRSEPREPASPLATCPLLADSTRRNRAWQVVARIPATRGSTYNFVSAGDADVSAFHAQRAAADVRQPASSRPSPRQSGRTTLRSLLQPVLHPVAQEAQYGTASTPALLRTIDFTATRDPRGAMSIDQTRCSELVAYFMAHLEPWVAVVSLDSDHLSLCPLLYTAVCYQASKYSNSSASETASLASHCRTLCVIAFAETQNTCLIVLAFYLLAAWKTADDGFTDWYMSYADQVARHLALSTYGKPDADRVTQRTLYFHYVQRHVILLHHGSSSNYDRHTPGARNSQELTKQLVEWSQSPQALPGDWFLCADVESTSIQCRYAIAFTDRHERRISAGAYSIAETVSSKSLLDDFVQEMVDWEERWSYEASKVSEGLAGSATPPPMEHTVGFGLFKNSVRGHVASYALKDALKIWLQDRRSSNRASLPNASLSLAEEYLNAAYLLCLEGMLGVLQQFLYFSTDDDGVQSSPLLHAPDSLVILADHAALMVVYLLLLPGVLAEVSSVRPSSSRSRGDAASPHIASMVHTAEASAQECIDTVQEVKEQMRRAASTKSSACTAVHLSAGYLADLIELAGSSSRAHVDGPVVAQEADEMDASGNVIDEVVVDNFRSSNGAPSFDTDREFRHALPPTASPTLPRPASTTEPQLTQDTISDAEHFNDWLQNFLRGFAADEHGGIGSADMDFPMPSFM